MSLVVGTIVWVVLGTALVAAIGYMLDRATASREHKE